MPNWEYAFVACEQNGGDWKPKFLNGQEVRDWKRTTLYQFANQLGGQGWELVGYTATSARLHANTDFLRLAFKRQTP